MHNVFEHFNENKIDPNEVNLNPIIDTKKCDTCR